MSDASLRAARADRARSGAAVPSRIMVPRLIYLLCAGGLVLFGLLMIYSASSIVGLTSNAYDYDPMYFLVRQIGFAVVGLFAALVLVRVDYHVWTGPALKAAWAITLLSLILVYTPVAGQDAYGATRWISLGSFSLQPSEFAKVTVLLTGAHVASQYYEEQSISMGEAGKLAVVGVVLPMALILGQPDKGTTGVLAASLLVMLYLAGFPTRYLAIILAVGVAAAAWLAFRDEYSRARVMTMLNPFNDPYGAGYQLVQGFYALGSGGLTGVGLGMSRQKYNYLPMAHNDFIFAVVGEELGFVGTVGLLLAFAFLLWAGLKIAENAPDLMGRLIAGGCTSLLVVQMLLNVCGVVGIFPLSGKPVPFISYGGSSIISSLMLVGLVLSVSLHSHLPETRYDERRSRLRIADTGQLDFGRTDAYDAMLNDSTAGQVHPRSARLTSGRSTPSAGPVSSRAGFRVVEGGASRTTKPAGRVTVDKNGRKRIDLGPSPAERLRGRGDKR